MSSECSAGEMGEQDGQKKQGRKGSTGPPTGSASKVVAGPETERRLRGRPRKDVGKEGIGEEGAIDRYLKKKVDGALEEKEVFAKRAKVRHTPSKLETTEKTSERETNLHGKLVEKNLYVASKEEISRPTESPEGREEGKLVSGVDGDSGMRVSVTESEVLAQTGSDRGAGESESDKEHEEREGREDRDTRETRLEQERRAECSDSWTGRDTVKEVEKKLREWGEEVKRQILESEERLKVCWQEEGAKIRRELTPLPCRCDQMNVIIEGLLGEAEQWKLLRYKDKVEWMEEKKELEEKIEELVRARREELGSKPKVQAAGSAHTDDNNNATTSDSSGGGDGEDSWTKGKVRARRRGRGEQTSPREDKKRVEETKPRRRGSGEAVLTADCKSSDEAEAVDDERESNEPSYIEGRPRGEGRKKPTLLSEVEWRWESEERRRRKRNIVVRGIGTAKGNKATISEIKHICPTGLRMEPRILRVRRTGFGAVATLSTMEEKREIMRRKKNLKASGVWIEDDLTTRERERSKNGWTTKRGDGRAKGWRWRKGT